MCTIASFVVRLDERNLVEDIGPVMNLVPVNVAAVEMPAKTPPPPAPLPPGAVLPPPHTEPLPAVQHSQVVKDGHVTLPQLVGHQVVVAVAESVEQLESPGAGPGLPAFQRRPYLTRRRVCWASPLGWLLLTCSPVFLHSFSNLPSLHLVVEGHLPQPSLLVQAEGRSTAPFVELCRWVRGW